ncbi:phosphotransferase family protein [Streptomyces sp. NBC_00620]|uniref:phosphotransferase family protein n=1 Tax=Streptomyces sp. NBC_00620 TaxID=2903666 RepID=UPI002253BD1A|nr:aminoglycoside phosphotransferase family protein [Streptomyces sp. NBC_00620]MCX4976471.1 aminoglycoside phosphotransferase family protein [Streptomyces sp. NBC_00620]
MTISAAPAPEALEEACRIAGFDPAGAEPIRVAENEIWRLPNRVIVRIARAGQWDAAAREVRVAEWLADNQVPAVRTLCVDQPVDADDRPVTFWEELPEHVAGSVMDVVTLLKQLHALPIPDLQLGRLDPFVRVADRIDAATSLSDDDRGWLHQQLADLQAQWLNRPEGLPECVVHGDAWVGNTVRTAAGPILIDFERVSVGPPEWDLVSTAVKMTTTGAVSKAEYAEFCSAYGTDVTQWEGYELLAGARQLRMTSYAAQHAATRLEWQAEAQYRVDCLRGRTAPPPWGWKGIM